MNIVPVALFACLLLGETLAPLRTQTRRKLPRFTRNLALGGIGAFLTRLAIFPSALAIASFQSGGQTAGGGVLGMFGFGVGSWASTGIALLLLDYTLYLWHLINHRVPWLWRFHLVHHVDQDMDASTGLRFHFGELALSTFYRAGQIIVIGADAGTLILFESLVVGCSLFHHANIRLPAPIDRALTWITVTPRYHGVHHSQVRHETDSNFCTILTVWDRLHRTLRWNANPDAIRIGIAEYGKEADVGFWRCVREPFLGVRRRG